jgi:hypothetical protein
MSRPRTSFDEIDSPATMRADAAATGRTLHLGDAPGLEHDDYPREVAKRDMAIDEAAARLANALHLHLD